MNKKVASFGVILIVAAALPFALIARSRSRTSPVPALHPVLDMDKQPVFKPQRENRMFADGRAMRFTVPGAEARDDLGVPRGAVAAAAGPQIAIAAGGPVVFENQAAYDRIVRGVGPQAGGALGFVGEIPIPVDMELMRRGQERFRIYCASCHGLDGYGEGMVARRAAQMQAAGADSAAGWVPPANYHTDAIRNRPVGHLFHTITQGIRTMPAHGRQIPIVDRWAIVAYVKALQRSQNAKPDDVPAAQAAAFAPVP